MQRGGDARTFSPKQRRNGLIEIWNEKVDKFTWVPEPAQLTEAIEAMTVVGTDTLLVTEFGKPFSEKGFGNWFKKQCVRADLPHCTAHGVRKSTARQLADHVEATQQQLKAPVAGEGSRGLRICRRRQPEAAGGSALDPFGRLGFGEPCV
jgi:integrase